MRLFDVLDFLVCHGYFLGPLVELEVGVGPYEPVDLEGQ